MANRREQILQSAIVRIAEQGESFSTEQVAQDAMCSQSLVFRHFGSKEGLMAECYVRVCREITGALHYVRIPEVLTVDTLNAYAMDIWDAEFSYLRSNSHIARTYLFFVGRGMRFPEGFRTPREVMKQILGDRYDDVMSVYPGFDFVAGYMMVVANVAASGNFIDWVSEYDDSLERIHGLLKQGVYGIGGRI